MNAKAAAPVPSPGPCEITAMRLRKLNPLLSWEEAETHATALEAARHIADLTTPGRVRQFMGQAATETGGFKRLRENMRYRDPVRLDTMFSAVRNVHHARQLIAAGPEATANCVYALRYGNGRPESGDGWRYRGGGYLQITFRANYRAIGKAIGMPLEACPELLQDPPTAAEAAMAYWHWRRINTAADADDTRAVTELINPALVGLDERKAWVGRAREIWP